MTHIQPDCRESEYIFPPPEFLQGWVAQGAAPALAHCPACGQCCCKVGLKMMIFYITDFKTWVTMSKLVEIFLWYHGYLLNRMLQVELRSRRMIFHPWGSFPTLGKGKQSQAHRDFHPSSVTKGQNSHGHWGGCGVAEMITQGLPIRWVLEKVSESYKYIMISDNYSLN